MPEAMSIAFFGDCVGATGRQVVGQGIKIVREHHAAGTVILNGENVKNGSGITPDLYRSLRVLGADAVTLGDHAFRDNRVSDVLADPAELLLRPANLSAKAPGKRFLRIPAGAGRPRDVFVITVLGRIFMSLPADDPFACVDAVLASLPEKSPVVIVEAHMEATSEKAAIAHYLDGRVTAVIGTHTHVATADARVLQGGTAFITDVGMCGPHRTIIGRDVKGVLRAMTTGVHTAFEMGSGDDRANGCIIAVDPTTGRATAIERFEHRTTTL